MAHYSTGLEDRLDIPQSSIDVLEKRYLWKNDSGEVIETGEDMLHRVARNIALADAFYLPEFKGKVKPGIETKKLYKITENNERIRQREEEFYNAMANLDFLPNSPTLMNAGNSLQQLSACFVLPIEDSMKKIFGSLGYTADIHKSGGGTGFSFGKLRPNGAFIQSTKSYSPGPISFLLVYDAATGQITQGGKRRGANMGVLPIDHPDSLDWIYIKHVEGRIPNFNLSLALTDEFMGALENDGYFKLKDPRQGVKYTKLNLENKTYKIKYSGGEFDSSLGLSEDKTELIDRYTGKVIGKIDENGELYLKAREVFDLISENAWEKGEPGVVFIDRINEHNPTPNLGRIESTNPCGEQPLLPYESCNLGSINLPNMVITSLDGKPTIDYNKLESIVRTSVRFLDNVIDMNKYPIPEIAELTNLNRKIGLGVMGFAHMLIKLGVDYNSEKAVVIAEEVMSFIQQKSKEESMGLAQERGAFPNFENSTYKDGPLIRNATTTTIAPTGSIGVIASTSQGIEPIFSLAYTREVEDTIGKKLFEVDRVFKEILEQYGLYDPDLILRLANGEIKLADIKGIPEEQKRLFVTAHDIHPKQHLKIQAAFQNYVDNAVSKTINLPKSATVEDIKEIYKLAYHEGCKGVTVYRDGSRVKQVITSGNQQDSSKRKSLEDAVKENALRGRNNPNIKSLPGRTYEVSTGCGSLFVTVNEDDYGVCEVFLNMNPPGGCADAQTSSVGISVSMGLQENVNPNKIVKHFTPIRCPKSNDLVGQLSCSTAIAYAINKYNIDTGRIVDTRNSNKGNNGKDEARTTGTPLITKLEKNISNQVDERCPNCNHLLEFGSGCGGGSCPKCTYSNCG